MRYSDIGPFCGTSLLLVLCYPGVSRVQIKCIYSLGIMSRKHTYFKGTMEFKI